MTPNEFVTNAVRTESRIEVIQANEIILNDLIDSITALSGILDQVKKNVFYGKAFNNEKITEGLEEAAFWIKRMQHMRETYPGFIEQKKDLKVNPRIFHAIVGLATETSELLEAMYLDTPEFDRVNILEELGDQNWYQAIAIDELQASFEEDVLDRVIAKLRARFPNKFNSEDAINRDLVKERAILEGKGEQNP